MTPAGGIVEATENTIHRDYVRWKPRATPFVRIEESECLRALDSAYRAWAHARNLEARPGAHRFTGRYWGRGIAFFTGLSGTKPICAEIMIDAVLPVRECVLVERGSASEEEKTQERTTGLVLPLFTSAAGHHVRSVGVTPRGLRVRLEPMIPPEDVDAVLDVLIELVSSIACLAAPRGSGESVTIPFSQ